MSPVKCSKLAPIKGGELLGDLVAQVLAADLVYDYRGFPERGQAALCSLLHRSLNDPTKRFTYLLDIREIIVAGDVAIVRLVWTVRTVRKST